MLRGPFLTLPNLITLARIPLALGAMTCVVQGPRLAAQLLMFAAFATDALDGAIARRMGSTSQWGRVLDPVADKLIFALLGGSMAWLGLVPWWLVVLIMGRDLAVMVGGMLYMRRVGEVPSSKTLGRLSTVLLATYMFKQTFWPAAPVLAGLDALGWLVVLGLGISAVDYASRYSSS
jgi:cardiolipin synthase (CMP-forming)